MTLPIFDSFGAQGWTLVGSGGVDSPAPQLNMAPGSPPFGWINTQSATIPRTPSGLDRDFGSTLLSPSFSIDSDGKNLQVDLAFLSSNGDTMNDYAYVQLLPAGLSPVTLYGAAAGNGDVPAIPCPNPGRVPKLDSNAKLLDEKGGLISDSNPAVFRGKAVGLGGAVYGPTRARSMSDPGPANPPGGATGWVTASFPIAPGSYQLFLVAICMRSAYPGASALAIKDIRLSNAPAPPQRLRFG